MSDPEQNASNGQKAEAGFAPSNGSANSVWRRERCLCDICVRISPMQARIRDALTEQMRKDFDYLTMRMMCAEEDRDVAEAKLAGQWPGWEWIKDARVRAEGYVENLPNDQAQAQPPGRDDGKAKQ